MLNSIKDQIHQFAYPSIGVEGYPLIITGDFNAEPSEPVIQNMTSRHDIHLQSAYK